MQPIVYDVLMRYIKYLFFLLHQFASQEMYNAKRKLS